jgi:hypothetical protein
VHQLHHRGITLPPLLTTTIILPGWKNISIKASKDASMVCPTWPFVQQLVNLLKSETLVEYTYNRSSSAFGSDKRITGPFVHRPMDLRTESSKALFRLFSPQLRETIVKCCIFLHTE